MLTYVVAVSILCLQQRVSAQATCASQQGPCLPLQANGGTVYLCPDQMACIGNSTCCLFADIVAGGATTQSPSVSCVDKVNPTTGVSDCPKSAYLCNDSNYYALMTEQCPKTCGRCNGSNNGGVPSVSCVDKINPTTGVSDCPQSAYLCTNAAYVTLMRDQCPKTCGFC